MMVRLARSCWGVGWRATDRGSDQTKGSTTRAASRSHMASGKGVGMVSECRTPHADTKNSINRSIIKPFPTRSGDPRGKKEAWSARRAGGKQSDLPRACPCASPARLKPIFAQQRLRPRLCAPVRSNPVRSNPVPSHARMKRSLRRTIWCGGGRNPAAPGPFYVRMSWAARPSRLTSSLVGDWRKRSISDLRPTPESQRLGRTRGERRGLAG